jgi:polyhydroxyalkanoate synthesis regulator phasin
VRPEEEPAEPGGTEAQTEQRTYGRYAGEGGQPGDQSQEVQRLRRRVERLERRLRELEKRLPEAPSR